MANGLNKVMLLGNLGKDPDIQVLDSAVKKASFSLATSETYRDKEGARVDKVEWHNIVVWRGLAETAEKYLHKGSKIYLEGKIRTRNYQDQTGATRYITEIVGDSFIMLDRKEDNGDGFASNASVESKSKMAAPAFTPMNNDPFVSNDPLNTPISSPDEDLPF
ncbi:MAG: single-stranded DNA-binding protein [Bacteroidales bacterium]|nr:single-stranded DNA-binding protein [Bacteroidales bacterium]